MWRDGEQVFLALCVDPSEDEGGADLALVPEEVLLEHGHGSDDAGGAPGGEGVQGEVGGDEGGGEFGVGGGTGAAAADVLGYKVDLESGDV
jgi:hypothetical protein